MPYSVKAADVGKQFLERLGFHTVGIAECSAIDPDFTFFVAYGRTEVGIDPDQVKGDYLEVEEMDYYAINALIKERLGRKLSVVGAAIESDAHTVGIDAIMNMKGFAGNYGLERYPEMDALNMGATDALLVGGALTQEFVDDFARVLPPRTELRVIVRDATVLVLPPAMVGRFLRRGIRLEALTPLRVLALTVNPFRVPQPYQPKVFFSAVAEAVGDRVPMFDVVNGLARLPGGSRGDRTSVSS